jgi:hypothetical protein
VDGFVDFGWIFLQLGLQYLVFLHAVSESPQILFMLLMLMVRFLLYCKKSC